MLEIQRLRRVTQEWLGECFDIRAFRVEVLQDDVVWTVNPASLEPPFTGTHTLQTEPEP